MRERAFKFRKLFKRYKYRYDVALSDMTMRSVPTAHLLRNVVDMASTKVIHSIQLQTASFDSDISIEELGDILHNFNVLGADILQTEYPDYKLTENL